MSFQKLKFPLVDTYCFHNKFEFLYPDKTAGKSRIVQINTISVHIEIKFQKQEEVQPSTEPADMEGEQLISMVNKAVSAITTRLHSKS